MRIAAFVMLACVLAAPQPRCQAPEKKAMPKTAQDYLAAFHRGEGFTPPSTGLTIDGQPDPAALQSLGDDLATAGPNVRESIVALLVDVGRRTDPLTPKGADVVRDRQIIDLLAGPGLAKADLGREAAMDALRKVVTTADLASRGDAFARTLADSASAEALLLVAKAKPQNSKEVLDRLGRSPRWRASNAFRIASAALGDRALEEEFLAALSAAHEGKGLAEALGSLGLIGTPRALRAVAEQLRTPWTIDIPGAYERSVRLNVLEALLYNFPDQPVLYPNNIIRDADYEAAEQFCTKTLGVTYRMPRPPFMTIRGYPRR